MAATSTAMSPSMCPSMEPELSNVVETRLLRTRAPSTPSIEIGILEKRSSALDLRLPPMLLLHGATFGARLFDLPRAGYSLMAALASEGRAVYALDVRGFGTSLGGAAMAEPPSRNPPFAGVDEAIEDIAAAVDVIMRRQPPPYPPRKRGRDREGGSTSSASRGEPSRPPATPATTLRKSSAWRSMPRCTRKSMRRG
jgi:Alpha/beta hydrolase family